MHRRIRFLVSPCRDVCETPLNRKQMNHTFSADERTNADGKGDCVSDDGIDAFLSGDAVPFDASDEEVISDGDVRHKQLLAPAVPYKWGWAVRP